jgi:endonuclease III
MQKLITFLTVCILFLSCNNKNSSGTNQHPVHDGQNSEKDAKALFPIEKWNKLHLQIIFYGRSHSPARSPKLAMDYITATIGTVKAKKELVS